MPWDLINSTGRHHRANDGVLRPLQREEILEELDVKSDELGSDIRERLHDLLHLAIARSSYAV